MKSEGADLKAENPQKRRGYYSGHVMQVGCLARAGCRILFSTTSLWTVLFSPEDAVSG